MKEVHCGEFIAGCPHISRGETTEELMANVREHARREHDLTEINEQLRTEILRSVKER
jgi:predicted small metal-binding protein